MRSATAGRIRQAVASGKAAHESFLAHDHFFYLKLSLLLCAVSIAAYVLTGPAGGYLGAGWFPYPLSTLAGQNGGTWLGYTLGTIGALLIVWLMLFGIRKRRYGPGAFSLKAWLSAHVYLGLSLIVVATLHAAFQVGWNVHTLAYVLMLLVIASGIWGVVNYARLPERMTENRRGLTLKAMQLELAEIDRQCVALANQLGEEYDAAVKISREGSTLGGSAWRLLSGRDPRCGAVRALAMVEKLATERTGFGDRPSVLVAALSRKAALLQRARRDLRYKALMDVWLHIHVPLSFALLAALIAHIVSVFYYWG
jgi:hypothetical protein